MWKRKPHPQKMRALVHRHRQPTANQLGHLMLRLTFEGGQLPPANRGWDITGFFFAHRVFVLEWVGRLDRADERRPVCSG